jgi:hypothetical protein
MIASTNDYIELDSMLKPEEKRVIPADRAAELGERAGGIAIVEDLTTGHRTQYRLMAYGWQKEIT